MRNPNRRALLTGVGGLAAIGIAGGTPTLPPGQPFSPEFIEYLRCVQAHMDACDVPEPGFGTPELEAWDAATSAACEARSRASIVIRDRPVRLRQDFVELAIVVQQELWHQEPDGVWHAHSMNEELEDAMMRAVFGVVDGGAYV